MFITKTGSRILSFAAAVTVVAVLTLEAVHIADAVCVCRCSDYDLPPGGGETVRGVTVDGKVEVDTGSGCQNAFSYEYTGYFALENCDDDNVGHAVVAAGSNINITTGSTITPSSFTVDGAGHVQTFSASGTLFIGTDDGVHATQVYLYDAYTVSCNSSFKVGVIHDPDAPCDP